MSHTCGNILLHLIFSTRERRPLIKPEFRDDLFAYLGGIIREMNGAALIINGTADHVHVLLRAQPAHAPAEIARVVKTNSSRWIRERFPEFAWQTGYGVFSVSESKPSRRHEIHRQPGRTSQETFVPRRVPDVSRKK
jgi:putative transposase